MIALNGCAREPADIRVAISSVAQNRFAVTRRDRSTTLLEQPSRGLLGDANVINYLDEASP